MYFVLSALMLMWHSAFDGPRLILQASSAIVSWAVLVSLIRVYVLRLMTQRLTTELLEIAVARLQSQRRGILVKGVLLISGYASYRNKLVPTIVVTSVLGLAWLLLRDAVGTSLVKPNIGSTSVYIVPNNVWTKTIARMTRRCVLFSDMLHSARGDCSESTPL